VCVVAVNVLSGDYYSIASQTVEYEVTFRQEEARVMQTLYNKWLPMAAI